MCLAAALQLSNRIGFSLIDATATMKNVPDERGSRAKGARNGANPPPVEVPMCPCSLKNGFIHQIAPCAEIHFLIAAESLKHGTLIRVTGT